MVETARLLLREIEDADKHDLFEMDSDPEVHKFIENKPVKNIEEVEAYIKLLQDQYKKNGIARWAVVDKITKECIGWAGLKYYNTPINNKVNFYELGYRFKQKHWGKGYATEASKAIINFGFTHLPIQNIYAITHPLHKSSIHVLEKIGFACKAVFNYMDELTNWFEINKENWGSKQLIQ